MPGFIDIFGNCEWEILQNDFQDSPFFTSDYPIAIEKASDPRVLNKIVPLISLILIINLIYCVTELRKTSIFQVFVCQTAT